MNGQKVQQSSRLLGVYAGMLAVISVLTFAACSQGNEVTSSSTPSSTPASTPAGASSALESSHGSGGAEKSFGSMKATVPSEWLSQTPTSSMRQAQYALAKADGDSEDGELAVFYFGPGQGGSVEANIDRWIGQISQPDGGSSKDKAKTSKKEVSGLAVTLVDVSGTYSAGMMSNAPPRPGYRMLAAVVETNDGPWFFKLVGPEKTIVKWQQSFNGFINSFKKGIHS